MQFVDRNKKNDKNVGQWRRAPIARTHTHSLNKGAPYTHVCVLKSSVGQTDEQVSRLYGHDLLFVRIVILLIPSVKNLFECGSAIMTLNDDSGLLFGKQNI